MVAEHRDVGFPLRERRHLDFDDVEAEEEVFAEASGGDFRGEIAVRRGDDADVRFERLRAADALELARLQHAQELHLHFRRDFADFVEEERATFREFEPALALRNGVRERAFFVAEQFAFEKGGGERRAVHRHERAGRPRGQLVDRVGDEFLARAARAFHEDRRLRRRNLADRVEQRLHRRRGAHDALHAVALVEAAPEVPVFALEVPRLEGLREHHVELVEVDRLREEVLRAELHRLDRGFDRAVGGEHDAEDAGPLRADLLEEREAVAAGHPHVGEQDVRGRLGALLQRGGGRIRRRDVPFPAEGPREPFAGVAFVVHDEDRRLRRVFHGPVSAFQLSNGSTRPVSAERLIVSMSRSTRRTSGILTSIGARPSIASMTLR